MSVILALETSSEACSAALAIDGQINQRFELVRQGHSARILPMIEDLMDEAGLAFSAVDVIAFGRGPGSFTGVRIGASVTQGLAVALDCPVIAVSSLAALTQAVDAERVMVAQDARMNEIYWGCYTRGEGGLMVLTGEEHVSPAEEIRVPEGNSWIGAGSGFDEYGQVLRQRLGASLRGVEADLWPSAAAVARLAEPLWRAGQVMAAEAVVPSYVRDKVAKKPGNR